MITTYEIKSTYYEYICIRIYHDLMVHDNNYLTKCQY